MLAWRRRRPTNDAPTSATPTRRTAIHATDTGTPSGREEAAGNAETVTVGLTLWGPAVASRVTLPGQSAPKVIVVPTLPLASFVAKAELKVTTHPVPPPVEENVTTVPAPPR